MKRSKLDLPEADEKACAHCPSRRDVLAAGSAAFATIMTATYAHALSEAPDDMFVQPGDRIQIIKGEHKGEMLKPDMLVTGEAPIEAFPFDPVAEVLRRKNRMNRLIVIRLDPAEMDEETRAREVDGVLVFSAICTHRGCTINSWMPEEQYLRCHCHLSEFSALSGGSVMGGPARRKLAMVPLTVDADGFVVATEGFTSEVGGSKT